MEKETLTFLALAVCGSIVFEAANLPNVSLCFFLVLVIRQHANLDSTITSERPMALRILFSRIASASTTTLTFPVTGLTHPSSSFSRKRRTL